MTAAVGAASAPVRSAPGEAASMGCARVSPAAVEAASRCASREAMDRRGGLDARDICARMIGRRCDARLWRGEREMRARRRGGARNAL